MWRPGAARPLPRRKVHPAADCAGQGRRAERVPAAQRRVRLIAGAMTKLLGAQVIKDLQTFVSALDAVFGGFRQRAEMTYGCFRLQAPPLWWWPRRSATRCVRPPTSSRRLAEERMPLAGLVVNRVHEPSAAARSRPRAAPPRRKTWSHGASTS